MSNLLGLAVSESGIAIAEASFSRQQKTVTRTATFKYPAELSLDQPTALGEALGAFLKEHGFSAKRAVIGLPAKWLMAREKQIPPADRATASEMLRLQAERQFSPELKELAFDYAGEADSGKPSTVLLMATAQQNVERMTEMADSAGLNVVGITSSTLALSAELQASAGDGVVLSLASDAAEVVVFSEGSPRSLRHVPVTGQQLVSSNGAATAGLATLGGELLRAGSLSDGVSRKVTIWDGIGLDAAAVANLEKRAGYSVDAARDVARLNVVAGGPLENSASYGAAISLALMGMNTNALPINFVHSKLQVQKAGRFSKPAQWGILGGAAALLLIIFMIVSQHRQQSTLDDLTAQIKTMEPERKDAEAMVNKANVANQWFDSKMPVLIKDSYTTRTPVLDCMRYLTEKFPQEGSVWATSFSFHENGKGVLAGRAPSQRDGLAVYTDVLRDKHFAEVNLLELRPAGGNSNDWAFTMSFTFKGEVKP